MRVLHAAKRTGIGLHLLPVFYSHGNFGGAKALEGQRRFLHDLDGFMDLLLRLKKEQRSDARFQLGIAPHSLRAVTMPQLRAVTEAFRSIDPSGRIHMHLAEQEREVNDCLAFSGKRPAAWLLDELPVDERWCLVHATHLDSNEIQRLAATGAVAGLCPITEGNLGDGIFSALDWKDQGGRIGIGTDSNILVSVSEELRWHEYTQRLRHEKRNLLGAAGQSTGGTIYRSCLEGGAHALGMGAFGLTVGASADWITLNDADPLMRARSGDGWLDTWIFASDQSLVRHVFVRGVGVIREGHHEREAAIESKALDVLRRIS
jgi:formimidoylglutamate deiminase